MCQKILTKKKVELLVHNEHSILYFFKRTSVNKGETAVMNSIVWMLNDVIKYCIYFDIWTPQGINFAVKMKLALHPRPVITAPNK